MPEACLCLAYCPANAISRNTCTVITSSRYSVTGNAHPPIPAVLPVLYVTTIRQTVRYTQRPVWLKIYAIRITLYPFPTRYNGFFTGFFAIFQKKSNSIFSRTRAPFTTIEVDIFKWFGELQKAPILVLWFWVQNFRNTPYVVCTCTVCYMLWST